MRLNSRVALQCHEYLHKTYAANRFDLSLVETESVIADEYKKLGQMHEKNVIEVILNSSHIIHAIDKYANSESREVETAKALLRTDLDIIIGANISDACEIELKKSLGDVCKGDGSRVSRPDILVRIGVNCEIPVWAPVDIKSHSAFDESNKSNKVFVSSLLGISPNAGNATVGRISLEDAYQLAHYSLHLKSLGLASTDQWAGIVGRDGESIAWTRLGETTYGVGKNATDAMTAYLSDFSSAATLIDAAVARSLDAGHVVASMPRVRPGKFGCNNCEFVQVCQSEMESFDGDSGHVTLLATVTPAKAAASFPGIEGIGELRRESGLNDFGVKAQIRARVWQTGVPELLDPSEPLDIPEFDIEIDIDLENSQAALQDRYEGDLLGKDQVYLYGYGILYRSLSADWKDAIFDSFSNYEDDENAEFEVMLAMWQMLNSEIAKAKKLEKSLGIFHYSPHERTWWRNFARRHEGKAGVPSLEDVESFMNEYMVDLLPIARKVSLPTMGYSIKDLAPTAGFEWSVEDAGGSMSLIKYKEAVNSAADRQSKEAAKTWLRNYNLDDVRATFAVRNYLRSLTL